MKYNLTVILEKEALPHASEEIHGTVVRRLSQRLEQFIDIEKNKSDLPFGPSAVLSKSICLLSNVQHRRFSEIVISLLNNIGNFNESVNDLSAIMKRGTFTFEYLIRAKYDIYPQIVQDGQIIRDSEAAVDNHVSFFNDFCYLSPDQLEQMHNYIKSLSQLPSKSTLRSMRSLVIDHG